jgi:hypothetical protein
MSSAIIWLIFLFQTKPNHGGDGWLIRWDRWINFEVTGVAKLRGMGGSVGSVPASYGSTLGSNKDISQKSKWAI